MIKRVSLFGANSKSAKHLVKSLQLEGLSVSTYSSTESLDSGFKYDIYQPSKVDLKCEYAVYFSWTVKRDESHQRKAAFSAAEFARSARAQNVTVIFISSLAALPERNRSFYGVFKSMAEESMREHGHVILRPGTIVSEGDSEFSSSLSQLIKYKHIVRIFSFFSQEIFVPVVDVEKFSDAVSKIISQSIRGEFNLVDDVRHLEDIADVGVHKFRLPIKWNWISSLNKRGDALDRLLTLISISNFLRESRFQISANQLG